MSRMPIFGSSALISRMNGMWGYDPVFELGDLSSFPCGPHPRRVVIRSGRHMLAKAPSAFEDLFARHTLDERIKRNGDGGQSEGDSPLVTADTSYPKGRH
jgi:hypothetical protein